MQKTGGGNDPSCGCDMQAGWPSASSFPRGGLQGGGSGIKQANFSFSFNNNQGTKHKYTGTLKRNNAMAAKTNAMNTTMNTPMTNSMTNSMNTPMNNAMTNTMTNTMNTPMNNSMNTPMNNAMNNTMNMSMNTNRNTKKTNKPKPKNIASSAPTGYSNLAYKGKKYYKQTNSGEVFGITTKGTLGKSMGFYVTPRSGKPYLTQMPPPLENEPMETPNVNLTRSPPVTPPTQTPVRASTGSPPEPESEDNSPDPESEGTKEDDDTKGKSLSMNGGRRRLRHRHRHRRITRRKRRGSKQTRRRKH